MHQLSRYPRTVLGGNFIPSSAQLESWNWGFPNYLSGAGNLNPMGKKFTIAIAALIGCWPAAAQESALTPNATTSFSTPPPNASVSSAPVTLPTPVPVAPAPSIRLETKHSVPGITKGSSFSIARNNVNPRPPASGSVYDFVQTPFASSVRVLMASVAGGRLQLSGYHCLASSENFQLGLPGGGVLPSWGNGVQSHPAILVPPKDVSDGFNVTFTLRANESGVLHLRPLSAVNHAVMFVRGI